MCEVYLIAPLEKSIKDAVISFEKTFDKNTEKNRIFEIYTKRISENIGIEAIAQYLRQNAIETKCINMSIEEYTMEDTVKEIIEHNPVIVGVSLIYDLHVYNAIKLVAMLRYRGYKGHITLGGTFISLAYRRFLINFQLVDTIVIGDGEQAFLNLYNAVKNYSTIAGIPGVAFINSKGEINYTKQNYENNYVISTPTRDTLKYVLTKNMPFSTALIVGSRGCNNNCVYCAAPAMRKNHNKIWRERNPIDLVNEIEILITKYKVKYLYFCDDNFCGYGESGKKHLEKFVDEMKKRKLYVRFHAEIRADARLNKENILALKSVGLDEALIGIESGVQACLNRWKKGINVNENQKMINLLRECDVKVAPAYILVDPFTTVDELEQSYEFINKNKLHLERDPWYLFNQMIVYPGTELEEELLKQNIITRPQVRRYSIEELQMDKNIFQLCHDISVIEYEIVSPEVKIIWNALRIAVDEIIEIVNFKLPCYMEQMRKQHMQDIIRDISKIKNWRKNLGNLLINFLGSAVKWGKEKEKKLDEILFEIRTHYDMEYLGKTCTEFFDW